MRDGLVPVSILLLNAQETPGTERHAPRVRVSRKELRMFTRQLTSLLRAKMELVPAVTVLKEQSPTKSLRSLLDDLQQQMRDGNSFSDTLARHPRSFDPLFLSAIRAGEAAGKLDDILVKLVEFGEQQEQLESRLRAAIAYPLLLMALGICCLIFFMVVVVPKMEGLFNQLGGLLPWPTRVLIAASHGLSHGWMWILGAALVGGWLLRHAARSRAAAVVAENVLRVLPLTRDILEARYIGRFTRTLQLLLDSGLPVFQAMDIARPTLGSALIEQRMRDAQERVKQGQAVAESLKAARCFPPLVTHMIAVGEASGTLVNVLDELASYYERFMDETLRIATSLLEPLMIIAMGLLVGFCVLAMVMPMFQMTQLVH
jgi:type II secretory pathway component PulF